MAKSITITNGTGSADIINGTYSVTAIAPGYDNCSISPANITISDATSDYAFTIAATGTLTLHVTEDGTVSGTPIVGATFIRTDIEGTEYGNAITTDSQGNAVFNNVPYANTDAPQIYFRQTASDGNHEFNNMVQSTSMSISTSTVQITNALGKTRNFNLTDANYSGLPISNATLNLE